ncbi:hypothetical protein ACFSQ7_36515 [Paenibacillus rhizoplanae]
MVYLPYSTGDFHIGNRTATYPREDSSTFTMRYNGRNNVRSSLDWIYANVAKPDKLLIAGESAGGFGSAFWAPEISNHYKDSEIFPICGQLLPEVRQVAAGDGAGMGLGFHCKLRICAGGRYHRGFFFARMAGCCLQVRCFYKPIRYMMRF